MSKPNHPTDHDKPEHDKLDHDKKKDEPGTPSKALSDDDKPPPLNPPDS